MSLGQPENAAERQAEEDRLAAWQERRAQRDRNIVAEVADELRRGITLDNAVRRVARRPRPFGLKLGGGAVRYVHALVAAQTAPGFAAVAKLTYVASTDTLEV